MSDITAEISDEDKSVALQAEILGAEEQEISLSASVLSEDLTGVASSSELIASLDGVLGQISGQRYTTIAVKAGNYTYCGSADIGSVSSDPVWRILRLERVSRTNSIVLWADGNYDFDNIFDDYATLNYS